MWILTTSARHTTIFIIALAFFQGVFVYAQFPARESDSLALVALYNSTDGPNWFNNDGWLSQAPIGAWSGISTVVKNIDGENMEVVDILDLRLNNLRGVVPDLDLPDLRLFWLFTNQLTGTLPNFNMPMLEQLLLEDNLFSELPAFTALPSLQFAQFERNKLTFEDLEPNAQIASMGTFYSPQDTTLPLQQTVEGDKVVVRVIVGGTANRYEWRRNGVIIPNATDPEYTALESGEYMCTVANTLVPGLILQSETLPVDVEVGVHDIPREFNAVLASWDVYPNPLAATATLHYDLRRPGDVSIMVFNALGITEFSVFHSRQQPGQYDESFDMSGLPAGIYFCQLRIGEFSLARRIIKN